MPKTDPQPSRPTQQYIAYPCVSSSQYMHTMQSFFVQSFFTVATVVLGCVTGEKAVVATKASSASRHVLAKIVLIRIQDRIANLRSGASWPISRSAAIGAHAPSTRGGSRRDALVARLRATFSTAAMRVASAWATWFTGLRLRPRSGTSCTGLSLMASIRHALVLSKSFCNRPVDSQRF